MTTFDGHCCGNCAAFMPDPFNFGDQGACAVIDDDNIALGTYNWTTAEGDCDGWTQRTEVEFEQPRPNPTAERMKYEKRMRGDWS